MDRMGVSIWIFLILLLLTVQTSVAGDLRVTIRDDMEETYSATGSRIIHFSGPLEYLGIPVGSGTAILFRGVLPGGGGSGDLGCYDMVEWDIGSITLLFVTEMTVSHAPEHPVTVINKETGEKIITGVLKWAHDTDYIDLIFSW